MTMDGALEKDEAHEVSEYEPQLQPPVGGNDVPEEDEQETRLNVRLAPKVAKALNWMATIKGVSRVDAVRHAIGTAKFFLEIKEKGGTVYVKMPNDKDYQRVVFAD